MREQNTKCTKFFCHEIFIMKSFFTNTFTRDGFEKIVKFNNPQYFFKEPKLLNGTDTLELSYFWLSTEAINSFGATYSDAEFGSNDLIDLTKADNTLTYFGKYKLSIAEKKALPVYYKSYMAQGVYNMMFNYGKNKETTTQSIIVFSGLSFLRFL